MRLNCEESAGVREEPVVGHSGGEKVAPVVRGGHAEGDEGQDSISIDSAAGKSFKLDDGHQIS
jgi:hypothetical protein